MKKKLLIITFFALHIVQAQTVWTGSNITFEKVDFDTTSAAEDHITSNVWITRGGSKGLFNIKQEANYTGIGSSGNSPVDTEWAFGTTANYSTLSYTTWAIAMNIDPGGPNSTINQDMVVHLITDDIYIDIKLLTWTGGNSGGGFSYSRSTDQTASLKDILAKGEFSIYPNPSKSKLNISLNRNDNATKVEIFDILGKRIHMQTLTNMRSSINASRWNAGVYLVKITNSTGTQTKRFVKE